MRRACPALSCPALCLALLAVPSLTAQNTLVVPGPYANAEANSSTNLPWGSNANTSAIRVQYIYDSSTFTNLGVAYPVVITGARWRADGANVATGGAYSAVTIDMATATVDHALMSTTFANNLGNDLTQVYSGGATVAATAGTTPNNWHVAVTFNVPFFYDPTSGNDLAMDFAIPVGSWSGGASDRLDMEFVSGSTPGSRIYDLLSDTATVGTLALNQALVCEFSFFPAPGYAAAIPYGTGCGGTPISNNVSLTSDRPVEGTTMNVTTDNIPAGSVLGALILSPVQVLPGIQPIPGLGTCVQLVGVNDVFYFPISGPQNVMTFAIPSGVFTGTSTYAQAITISPGITPAGVAASNGLTWVIDVN